MGERQILSGIPDQELLAEVAGRGLSLPDAIESASITKEVEALADTHGQLLATAVEGARLYLEVINGINAKRDKKDQIPTLKPGEYRYRAQDWLTDNLTSAATYLPVDENRPQLLVPRLNRAITTQETFEAWGAASDSGIGTLSSRKKFNNWSADQLSGFDPEADPDAVEFQVLPTAYDKEREGTVLWQNKHLEALQIEVPELRVAAIFDGVVLAQRYKGQPRAWADTYVRAITLHPTRGFRRDYVPAANVNDGGRAYVGISIARNFLAARLVARS